MKVAAGRTFFERYSARAHEIVPDLQGSLIETDASWSTSPETCDPIVYAGDAYRAELAEAAIQMTPPR